MKTKLALSLTVIRFLKSYFLEAKEYMTVAFYQDSVYKEDSYLKGFRQLRAENVEAYLARKRPAVDTLKKIPKGFSEKILFYKSKGIADPETYVKNQEQIKKSVVYTAMKYPELYKLPENVRLEILRLSSLLLE